MTALRITLGNKGVGKKIKRTIVRQGPRVREAIRATAEDVAGIIEERGAADIQGAGNFGQRWLPKVTVGEGGGHIRIRVTMGVPYWSVFQTGKVIYGKPLLWIPLDFAVDAKGVSARDFPGQLFRVNRKAGAPLLMQAGKPAQPKYFGKESVNIPKKFHLNEIIEKASKRMQALYRANFKKAKP